MNASKQRHLGPSAASLTVFRQPFFTANSKNMTTSSRWVKPSADPSVSTFIIMILERAGKKVLKHPNAWECIANNTVAAFTAKRKGI